jgi:gliding motility-associated lipoprotein GldH
LKYKTIKVIKKKFALTFFNPYLLGVVIFSCMIGFTSCNKIGVYEKNTPIPKYNWQNNFVPSFTFNITDTTSRYNIYMVVRHTDAYQFNNVWCNATTTFPGEAPKQQRLEVVLGNDANGWEGTGMDDIWELRKPISPGPISFKKAGAYTFTIAQIMRVNPLPNILSVGIRVEKVSH